MEFAGVRSLGLLGLTRFQAQGLGFGLVMCDLRVCLRCRFDLRLRLRSSRNSRKMWKLPGFRISTPLLGAQIENVTPLYGAPPHFSALIPNLRYF